MLLDQIPGLAKAVARAAAEEARIRERAFLPVPQSICGVPVLPLTLRHLTMLHAVASPLITSHPGDLQQCHQYLWIVSPEHVYPTPRISAREVRAARKAWTQRMWPQLSKRGRTLDTLTKAIFSHVSEALFDIPKRGSGSERPISHFAAAVLDEFSGYPYPRQTLDERGLPIHDGGVLDMPFAQIVQLRRCRTARTTDADLANPLSDNVEMRLAREYLAKHGNKPPKPRSARKAT